MSCVTRTLLTAAAVPLLLGVPAAAQAQDDVGASDSFTDDDGNVHESALDAMAAKGWLAGTGCGEGQICPKRNLQRWELAVWLGRALTENSEPPLISEPRFSDVDPMQWWAPHAERFADFAVADACDTEPLKYCAYNAITRAQMATFIARAFELSEFSSTFFADITGDPHAVSVNTLAAAGITIGCDTQPPRYCPTKPITRAQAATFIAKAAGLVPKSPPPTPVGLYHTVTAGWQHSCAIGHDDAVTCWGNNDSGQANAPAGKFRAVSAGWQHSCAIAHDDAPYWWLNIIICWGTDKIYGTTKSPMGVFKAVAAGGTHNCAIAHDDTVTCWGNNYSGQADPPAGKFKAITAGWQHSCALDHDDTVTCWGNNDSGQAHAPTGAHKTVAAGGTHNCAVARNDMITCWGNNDFGQADAPAGKFRAVSAGWQHSCAIAHDDTVTCWGNNDGGQANPPSGAYNTIAAGWSHNCAIGHDYAITCWGNSNDGRTKAPTIHSN